MYKKELKFYETPACEVVELEPRSFLCASGDVQVDGLDDPDDITGGNAGKWD